MFDIIVDSFDIEEFLMLAETINSFHSEHLLKDFLCSVEEDIFVFVTKI
jgi:hypothetical protein